MRSDSGALPLLAVLVIIGAVLLFVGLIVLYLTLKMILALLLAGVGLYLLIKPERMAGLDPRMKMVAPILLIVLGLAVYAGWLEF